jgi:type I restriction enzyme S subunit
VDFKEIKLDIGFEFIRNGLSIKQGILNGLPITRIETISNQVIDVNKFSYAGILEEKGYENWLLKKGDILLSHINSVEHLGKCALYEGRPDKLIHGMNLLCLRPNLSLLDPYFALYFLRSKYFKIQLPQIINHSVNQSSISVTN